MATTLEFVGASHQTSRHTSFAQRYQRRLDEARTNHAIMTDLLSGGDRSINEVIDRFQLTRNIIILRLVTLASTAAEIGGLRLDQKNNSHTVLLDILSKQYDFTEITNYYRISRNVMIMCLADVAKEAVDAANAKGCDNKQLFRVMAYTNRGEGLSIAESVAKVQREDREKRSQTEKGSAEKEWVMV